MGHDLQKGVECGPAGCGELGSSVQDDCFGEAMEFPDIVEVHAGDVSEIGGLVARDQVLHFGESVHYHQDDLEPFT